jgi:hypothetical protein
MRRTPRQSSCSLHSMGAQAQKQLRKRQTPNRFGNVNKENNDYMQQSMRGLDAKSTESIFQRINWRARASPLSALNALSELCLTILHPSHFLYSPVRRRQMGNLADPKVCFQQLYGWYHRKWHCERSIVSVEELYYFNTGRTPCLQF